MEKEDKKFFNIYLDPKKGVTTAEVEAKINLALDWFRYNDNCYVVYSNANVEKWMVRLKPFVQDDGRLFICEINLKNRNGWMIPDFWKWVGKEREK